MKIAQRFLLCLRRVLQQEKGNLPKPYPGGQGLALRPRAYLQSRRGPRVRSCPRENRGVSKGESEMGGSGINREFKADLTTPERSCLNSGFLTISRWASFGQKSLIMEHLELLAITSLSGARMGIDGLVLLAFYSIGVASLITYLGRHEYDLSGSGIFCVIAISLFSAGIGGAIGDGSMRIAMIFLFCGAAALLTSGPFLEFRVPHRLALALSAPVIYFLSSILGSLIRNLVIENALK